MKPRIAVSREWADEDIALLAFEVCDGKSIFTNEAYAPFDWGAKTAKALRTFSGQLHGGLFNLDVGEGGFEYAAGAFRARFHYFKPTELLISTRQEGEFFVFKDTQVAAEAKMFLRTEPGLLDRFIADLPILDTPAGGNAVLECIELR